MIKNIIACVCSFFLATMTLACAASAEAKEPTEGKGVNPMVVLAYDGTGDFGPETPGTKTAGWQEALDYCVQSKQDLYVKGGYGGLKAIYHVNDTIRVPPAQDFRIDGGVYVINWEGPADKDLMLVDSAMNCEYHFGILVYGGTGAGMRVRPEKPVPIDGFPVVVETIIQSEGIADPSPFTPGERKAGTGLVFDGAEASIASSNFYFAGVLNFHTCIETRGVFQYNRLECPHLHTNADNSTLFQMGDGSLGNDFRLVIGVDQGATGVTGVVAYGDRNVIDLAVRPSNAPFPPGRALVLTEPAEGNQINLIAFDDGDLSEAITDNAVLPSNQVTWAGPPLPIRTVNATADRFTYEQRLYPATVRVVGGEVTDIALVRGETSLDCDKACGQDILLSVGDRLIIESVVAPVLYVVPFKTK